LKLNQAATGAMNSLLLEGLADAIGFVGLSLARGRRNSRKKGQ